MAQINTIQVGRLNRLMQKLLSMKGAATLDTLSPELMPVLSIFHGVENRYLEGWNRFAFRAQIAGAVGQNAAFRLRNPAGTNVIAIIEKLTVFTTAAADQPSVQIAATAADLATSTPATRLDPRGQGNTSLIFSSSGTGVALATTIEQLALGTNATGDFILTDHQELSLLPGDAVQVISNSANQQLNGLMIWRERFLEDSERA